MSSFPGFFGSFSALSSMTAQLLTQWPGSVLHHRPLHALGLVALRTRTSWRTLSLVPACSGLGPQMVLDAGAPKCKSINYCIPYILHASVQGTQGKSVLPGKGLFIFPVMWCNVVGNRNILMPREMHDLKTPVLSTATRNKGRELPRDVAPRSSDWNHQQQKEELETPDAAKTTASHLTAIEIFQHLAMLLDQSLWQKRAAKMQSAAAAGDGRIWRKEMQIFGRLAQNRDGKAVWDLEPPGYRRQLIEMQISRGTFSYYLGGRDRDGRALRLFKHTG